MAVKTKQKLRAKHYSDRRGELYVNEINGVEFNTVFTKAGAYRAGDYHQAKQYSVIFSGEIEITLRQNNRDVVKKYDANKLVIIPPNTPHLYKFLTDTVMVEWLDGKYEPKYYEPYREIIDRQLKKNK